VYLARQNRRADPGAGVTRNSRRSARDSGTRVLPTNDAGSTGCQESLPSQSLTSICTERSSASHERSTETTIPDPSPRGATPNAPLPSGATGSVPDVQDPTKSRKKTKDDPAGHSNRRLEMLVEARGVEPSTLYCFSTSYDEKSPNHTASTRHLSKIDPHVGDAA